MLQIIIRIIIEPLFWLLYWPKPKNWRNMFQSGPVIYMSNHKRWFDPVMIILFSVRPVYIMGKIELFKNKFIGWFLRSVNAFPITRGKADVSALKQSINVLKKGKVLLIFPEGHRTAGDSLNELHEGVSFIAARSKATIVPIYIHNDYGFFNTARVTIGKPIDIKKIESEKNTFLNKNEISKILFSSLKELGQGE